MYTLETRVRYSECDSTGHAGLASILDYLQDTCTFHAESLDIGVDYQEKHHIAWILNSWQVDIARYPVLGESIRISTWAYDFYGFYGLRNFLIASEQGEILLRANSIWVLMDIDKGRPVKLPPKMQESYQKEQKLPMEYLDRKIPDFEANTQGEPFKVPHNFIDTNRHMNNAKYVLLAEELLPEQFTVGRIHAEYKKSAVLGDLIYPAYQMEENCLSLKLNDEKGKPYVILQLYAQAE